VQNLVEVELMVWDVDGVVVARVGIVPREVGVIC